MTTLRIAIDSSGAVRGANEAKEAIRGVGAAAQAAETSVRSFSQVDLELGNLRLPPDPFGVEAAVARGKAALAELRRAQELVPFGAGIPASSSAGGFSQVRDEETGRFTGRFRTPVEPAFGAGLEDVSIQATRFTAQMAAAAEASKAAAAAAAAVNISPTLIPNLSAAKAETLDLVDAYRAGKITLGQFLGTESFGGKATFAPSGGAFSTGGAAEAGGNEVERYAERVERSSSRARGALELQARSLLRFGVTIGVFGAVAAAANELVTIESGLVRIERTTGLSADALDELKDSIVELGASGLPVATTDLLKFAESAGKLQIRTPDGIKKFVADLALVRTISPRLGGEAANVGEEIGSFLRLVGESPAAVQPLSDSITRLQKEFGATGDEIFSMGSSVAQAGAGFIRSSADALAFGAAFKTLSLDSEQGGMAIAKVMKVVRDAIYIGGPQAKTLRDILGFTPEDLERAFNTDAAMLFTEVLSAVGRQGTETARVLDDLGLGAARQGKVFTPLIANADQLRRALAESRDAQLQGTDAAAAAEKQQKTLASELQNASNLFTAAVGANQGFVSSLAGIVSFGNDVTATLLGIDGAAKGASDSAKSTATALEAAATAGLVAVGIQRATTAWRGLTSALTVLSPAAGGVEVVLTGLPAAVNRAGTAIGAFISSPLGLAVAAGTAVYGLTQLQQHLNELSAAKAKAELDQVAARISALDQAADGLARADALILRADMVGDAEAKAQALTARLRELEDAQAAVAGAVIRANPQAQERLDEVKPKLRATIEEAVPEGTLLDSSAIERRLNEAIAAAVRGVEIPGVPEEKAEEFRASVTRALSGATIPTEQLRALKIDELFPDVQASGNVFRQSLIDAVRDARVGAEAEAAKVAAEDPNSFGFTPPSAFFPQAFRESLGEQVEVLFGPEVGARAQAVLTATIRGLEIPGIDPEKSKGLSDSINATIGLLSGDVAIDDAGVQAMEKSLRAAGVEAGEATLLIAEALSPPSGTVEEQVRVLAILLDAAGANAVSAKDAMAGLTQAAAKTKGELDEINRPPAEVRLSDFYVEESKRITTAIREAELSINRLTVTPAPRSTTIGDETTVTQGPDLVLVGIEARREAIRQERIEYEKLIDIKSGTKTPVEQRITGEEAALLRDRADAYLEVRDAVLLFAEAQRRLQAEENVLQRVQGVLGQQLSILGARAQGETAQAFSLMRQEVELSTLAQLKNIEAMERSGAPSDEVAKYREVAAAQRELSLAGIKYQEWLVKNRRAVDDLSNASSSFASNATSALLGLQEPAEALRSFLIDIARQFLEPRLQNAFLGLFHDGDKETLDAPSRARAAAEQAGVGDLFRRDRGDGPQLPPAPSPFLQEQVFAQQEPIPPAVAAAELQGPVAPPLEQVGLAAGQATAGLEGVGPAAQGAAGGLDRAGTSSETAATAADRLAAAAERAAIALDRISGSPQAAAAAVDVQGPVLPDALEAASSDAQELAFNEVQGPRAPLPPLDLSSAFAPPAGADADLPGLDALDSGAEDAARAVAGLPEPVQLAAEGLDELSPAVKLASSSVGGLGEKGQDRLIDSSVRDQVAQNRLGFGFAHQASNSAAAAGIGGQLPIRGLDLSDTGDAALADLIGPINQLGPATELATVGMESAAKAGELVAGGMQLVAPAVESTAFSLTPMQQAVIAAVTGFNAATNAVIQFAAAASAAAARSAVGFSHGGVVGGGEVRAFADGGMPTVSDLSGSVISGPTYALIGEGDDDEAIMPLDARGGVRGVNQRGEPVSLPLGRDKGGKLGVRVDLADARAFSRGGVPGRDHALALFGYGGVPPSVSPEQALADRSSVVNNSSVDQSRTTTIYSTINVRGGGGLPNSGMKLTMRQMRAELQNLGRMVQQ